MPPTDSDSHLLREFAECRSESAFRELVLRHQNMVFSTARRRLGNDAAAADVTQQVFLALATKAAWLTGRASAGGWLYKAALHESAAYARSNARRTQREHLYATEMNLIPASDHDDDASSTAQYMPILDDALSSLPPDDREALVLRFFRGLSLRDTGASMGTTEEAARKRVSRALEKLSVVFKKKGVTVSAGVIAATLLPESLKAAPPALTAKVLASAAAVPATGIGGAMFLKGVALTKAKAVVLALGLSAIPVTWQAVRLQELATANAVLSQKLTESTVPEPPSKFLVTPVVATSLPGAVTAVPSRSKQEDASTDEKSNHRAKMGEWFELQRRQQREARLLALHERLILDDNQAAAIATAISQSDASNRLLFEAARESRTPPTLAQTTAITSECDLAINAVLTEDQRQAYVAFSVDEETNRREIYANRMLNDIQGTLYLNDQQKDKLFGLFSEESAAVGPSLGPWPAEALNKTRMEALSSILNEDQYKIWKQRSEMWEQVFSPPGK